MLCTDVSSILFILLMLHFLLSKFSDAHHLQKLFIFKSKYGLIDMENTAKNMAIRVFTELYSPV